MGSSSKPREFVIDDYIIPQPPTEEIIRVQVKNIFLFELAIKIFITIKQFTL